MATVISKADILKKSVPKVNSLDSAVKLLDKIETIMKIPFVQNVAQNMIGRFLGVNPNDNKPRTPIKGNLTNVQTGSKANIPDAEGIYNMLVAGLDKIILVAGNMPLSEVNDFLKADKERAIGMLKEVIAGGGVDVTGVKPKEQ